MSVNYMGTSELEQSWSESYIAMWDNFPFMKCFWICRLEHLKLKTFPQYFGSSLLKITYGKTGKVAVPAGCELKEFLMKQIRFQSFKTMYLFHALPQPVENS